MQPTLTMRHRPTSETLVVECDHGLTTAHGEDVVTHEQFGATLAALMARRECDCRPTVVVDEWPSLAEAIDLHPDEDRPEFGEVVGAQYTAVRQLLLTSRCPGCDPCVTAVISHWPKRMPRYGARGTAVTTDGSVAARGVCRSGARPRERMTPYGVWGGSSPCSPTYHGSRGTAAA